MKSKMSKNRSSIPSWTKLAQAKRKLPTDLAVPVEYLNQVREHAGHDTDMPWDQVNGRKKPRALVRHSCGITLTIPGDED